MAPYGYQWFSLQDRAMDAMHAGATKATPLLNDYLDEALDRFSLSDKDMAIVGFSQGTMMALYTSLRRTDALAGIVGFSGALLGAEGVDETITARPPVCLIHGTHDTIVPFDALAYSEANLSINDVPVEAHARPGLGHSIDESGIATAITFLQRCFSRA